MDFLAMRKKELEDFRFIDRFPPNYSYKFSGDKCNR